MFPELFYSWDSLSQGTSDGTMFPGSHFPSLLGNKLLEGKGLWLVFHDLTVLGLLTDLRRSKSRTSDCSNILVFYKR